MTVRDLCAGGKSEDCFFLLNITAAHLVDIWSCLGCCNGSSKMCGKVYMN